MNATRRRRWLGLAGCGLGVALTGAVGCQTWVPGAGLTLPSGHYLEHPPQYIPSSPPFPLTRELAQQEMINARAGGGPAGMSGALPPGVPGAPGIVPGGVPGAPGGVMGAFPPGGPGMGGMPGGPGGVPMPPGAVPMPPGGVPMPPGAGAMQ